MTVEDSDLCKLSELFIEIPSGQIYTKTWTPHSHEKLSPIVLMHDSLGCVEMWRDFPQDLAIKLKRPVIAYDRLGFGRSSARAELPAASFIQDESRIFLTEILKALDIQDFILFGHSVGGAMALHGAKEFPKRCLAVVTMSAQAFVEEGTLDGIRAAKKGFEDPKTFEKLVRFHGRKSQWVLDAWTKIWLSEDFKAWSLRELMPQVKCPIFILHGENDEFGSQAFPDLIAELSAGIKEKKILSGIGHVPQRENPSLVIDLVDDFLSRHLSK